MSEATQWRFCRCGATGGRDKWVTRYGLLECGRCLLLAFVGLLEPIAAERDAAKE